MADTIRVMIAPGCHVPISPHPSGIPGLPALILTNGDTLDVTPERLRELLDARLILDPATGKPVPPPKPYEGRGVEFTDDGGRTWHADGRHLTMPVPLDPLTSGERKPIRAGAWNPGFNDMVRQWDTQSGDPITDAEGRPWPR